MVSCSKNLVFLNDSLFGKWLQDTAVTDDIGNVSDDGSSDDY